MKVRAGERPSDRPESTLGLLSVAATGDDDDDDNNTDINITITIATLIRTQTQTDARLHTATATATDEQPLALIQLQISAARKRKTHTQKTKRSQRQRQRRRRWQRRLRAPDVHLCTFEHELVADGYSQPARELIRMPLLCDSARIPLQSRCAGLERDDATLSHWRTPTRMELLLRPTTGNERRRPLSFATGGGGGVDYIVPVHSRTQAHKYSSYACSRLSLLRLSKESKQTTTYTHTHARILTHTFIASSWKCGALTANQSAPFDSCMT